MGGTLRRYLEPPRRPARRAAHRGVPGVGAHRRRDGRAQQQGVGHVHVACATDVDDPIERLQAIHEVTKGAKEDHNVIGANLLQDWAEHAAPTTFALAARLYSSMNLSDRHRPIHNVVISNVPGPPFPLYYAGAKAVCTLPDGPGDGGRRASTSPCCPTWTTSTSASWSCRELVPDVWDLADHVEDGHGRAAGRRRRDRPPSPGGRAAGAASAGGVSPRCRRPAHRPTATARPRPAPSPRPSRRRARSRRPARRDRPERKRSAGKPSSAKKQAAKKARPPSDRRHRPPARPELVPGMTAGIRPSAGGAALVLAWLDGVRMR